MTKRNPENLIKYMNLGLYNFVREYEGILVMEANMQGIFELNNIGEFKKRFPLTYKWYLEECLRGGVALGECIFQEEDGQRVALLVTAHSNAGSAKDTSKEMEYFTDLAVQQLFQYLADSAPLEVFVSPIMNSHLRDGWGKTQNLIKNYCERYDVKEWFVCVK